MSNDSIGGTPGVRMGGASLVLSVGGIRAAKAQPEHPIRAFMRAHEIEPLVARQETGPTLPELFERTSGQGLNPRERLRDTLLILQALIEFRRLGVNKIEFPDEEPSMEQLCKALFKPEMRSEISVKEAFALAKAALGSNEMSLVVALPHLSEDGKELDEIRQEMGDDAFMQVIQKFANFGVPVIERKRSNASKGGGGESLD